LKIVDLFNNWRYAHAANKREKKLTSIPSIVYDGRRGFTRQFGTVNMIDEMDLILIKIKNILKFT
jgi:hypothetical protein